MILKTFRTLAIALAVTTAAGACAQAGGGAASAQGAALGEVVRTSLGSVRGAEAAPGVMVYKGMPFAAAPVGELRFREAQAPKPWSGVLDGTKWGNTCIQPPAPTRAIESDSAWLPEASCGEASVRPGYERKP